VRFYLIRLSMSAIAALAVSVGPTLTANASPPPADAKWAIVLCKFAVPADPVAANGLTTSGVTTIVSVIDRSWITTFFTEAGKGKGGIFDYFAQVSNGLVSLSGTTVFPTTNSTNDDWYRLPLLPSGEGNLSWYASQSGQARYPIWKDCVNTAVSQGANFTGYYSVLVVTNRSHDDSALATGQGCQAPTPNNGPNIATASVVINFHNLYVRDTAHEMGHGFGLQHSLDTWDCRPPDAEYCDPYDLMSANNVKSFTGQLGITSDQLEVAPTGPGLNAPLLDSLGSLPANRKCAYTYTVEKVWPLEPLAVPASNDAPAKVLERFEAVELFAERAVRGTRAPRAVLRRVVQCSNVPRSSDVNVSSASGRPRPVRPVSPSPTGTSPH
jgi:hypothetical protein